MISRSLFWLSGVFRWRLCWAWQPPLPQSPKAKSLDPNNLSPGQSPRRRKGGNGRRSFHPTPRDHQQKMMVGHFLITSSLDISCYNCSLNLISLMPYWSMISPTNTLLELNPPVPFASRLLNTRTMKETFKSFVELLISIALDEDVMIALERANGEWMLLLLFSIELLSL